MRDCLVIGAGFGGLGAALSLAEAGARVTLCEALNYPGGCASTFTRRGHAFESGATLFSGFDEGQLFASWIARHKLAVETVVLDPIVELRAPGFLFPISSRRENLIADLCALPAAPVKAIRSFFERQKKIADTLWAVLDSPDLLPPLKLKAVARHASRTAQYAPLLALLGKPLLAVLEEEGVAGFPPLRLLVDAVCQITVQVPAAQAEALFALSSLDYFFRGTRHVHGGIGALAFALCSAIEKLGGEVQFANPVKSLEPIRGGWRVATRRGEIEAKTVIANLLPEDLRKLTQAGLPSKELDQITQDLKTGWSAGMLYRVLEDRGLPPRAHHFELVADPAQALTEGNHLFCSLSASDEKQGTAGERAVTISTHIPVAQFEALAAFEQASYVERVQAKMRATLSQLAPELDGQRFEMTASPRTFQRFTRRSSGMVGGIPRRAGMHNYRQLAPLEAAPGLFLVGDSVFPGQSTLATATGGQRVAAALLGKL